MPGADLQKLSNDLMLSPKIVSITRMCSENDQLNKREEALAEKVEMLWQRCGLLTQWPAQRIEDTFGEEIANIWTEFDAGDPYEMCFALIYLIDSGSDLPWCYFPGVNLHTVISALLPWPRTRYNIEADGIWRHYDPETGERVMGPDPTPLPKRIRVPEMESWYQLKYRDSGDADELYNLGQVIYEATGCIMPRKLDRYQPALSTLDRYGISGKKAVHPLLYCMTLLGEGKQQTKPSYASIGFVDEEKNEDSDAANASIEELRSEVQSLRNEVKMLRWQSYEYSREVRDEKIRSETMAQKKANDAQELHDLRELIFNQQNAVYDEPDIIVRCPKRMRMDEVKSFVESKSSWIQKHLANRNAMEVDKLTEQEIELLREQTRKCVTERVQYYAPIIGVTYGQIAIRTQRTRWGSCSSKGNLNFNCLLGLVPSDVLDYVVVHELCHRKELNHSDRFWAEVSRILPDYKQQKKWLKDFGSGLIARLG